MVIYRLFVPIYVGTGFLAVSTFFLKFAAAFKNEG